MNIKNMMNDVARSSDLLHQITQDEADRLKKAMLMIYSDVSKLCNDNNLTLMLAGGSALGAVRHHGFIPWDDDLDVMLYYPDYEKLIKLLENGALSDKYEFSVPNPKTVSSNRFMMIYLKDTVFEEVGMSKHPAPNGIKIDVFAIVDVPCNKSLRWINGMISNYLALTASCVQQYKYTDELSKKYNKRKKSTHIMSLAMRTIGFFSSIVPCHKWEYYFYKHSVSYRKKGMISLPSGRNHYLGEAHPYNVMFPISKGIFEGIEVLLPNNTDAYLSKLYGADYLQLPPIEKRERHFLVKLDFGKYNNL